MSIFNDPFVRSAHDPGVASFLKEVFIRIPLSLKTNQLVCKEWRDFIQNNLWDDQNTRNYFQTHVLEKRQRCGQFNETTVDLSVNIVNPVPVQVKCDDDLVLIDVSNIDAAELLLVNLHSHHRNVLKLGGFDLTKGEQLLYEIGHDFFVTAFSHRNKLLMWNKDGKLAGESEVTSDHLAYMRTVRVFKKQIFVLSRSKIYVLHKNADFEIVPFASVTCPESLGTVRSVVDYKKESQFLSAHDREVLVWDLDQDSAGPLRSIETDLVVDIARKDGVLSTVGSLQVPGVHLWNIDTGARIKLVNCNQETQTYLSRGIFFMLKLKGNHILVQGNYLYGMQSKNHFLHGVLNIKDYNLTLCKDDHGFEHCDISQSKSFFMDTERCVLIVNDYWS